MGFDVTLKAAISLLTEEEKATLCSFLSKAKSSGKITEFSMIHNMLKIDPDDLSRPDMQMSAPPLLKEYLPQERIVLPDNYIPLSKPLDTVLKTRSSQRIYTGDPITLQELSTLLYFSYGVREYTTAYNKKTFPLRMAPSSGGLQGVEMYVVVNCVKEIGKGLYHYNPFDRTLELLEEGNFRKKMVSASTMYEFVNDASIVLILTCVLDRLIEKYTIRSYKVVYMDVGFVGENIYLVGTSLGLGVCAIAGYFEERVDEILRINGHDEFVGLLMTVGRV